LKLLGVSEKTLSSGFRIEKLQLLFAPLRLLKFTHSLSQKHDVANEECEIAENGRQLTGTAKWGDILKLYEVDKHSVYRLLPKVTDIFSLVARIQ
jgi:hypothetical protein